jgi:hypothetical protein
MHAWIVKNPVVTAGLVGINQFLVHKIRQQEKHLNVKGKEISRLLNLEQSVLYRRFVKGLNKK